MRAVRVSLLMLAVGGLLLSAGCKALRGCSNPEAYSNAQDLPRLKIPVGLDGPDTSEAVQIPAQGQPAPRPMPEGACLEEPPPMREPGSVSPPERDVPDDESRNRRRNAPLGPPR